MPNAGTAQRVIEEIPSGSVDSELLHPQFRAWTISSDDLSAEKYLGLLKVFAGLFTPPLDPRQLTAIRPLLGL
jgi:hypothetical protein